MKLKNRVMSWILAPGAYLVWHALEAWDEWDANVHTGDVFELIHMPTGARFWTPSGPFCFDGRNDLEGSIGLIDRHIIWWTRAYPLVRYFWNREYSKPDPKKLLFTRMTQLTGKPHEN